MTDRVFTPSQTAGPFLHIGLTWKHGEFVVPAGTPGAVWVRGLVLDGGGAPVTDALVETWQVDASGRFGACGRSMTDPEGNWGVHTVVPEAFDGQAPHVDVSVFARGLLVRLVTRIYFPDSGPALETDPVLSGLAPARRATLIAQRIEDPERGYRFDIRLRGEDETDETVFFAVRDL